MASTFAPGREVIASVVVSDGLADVAAVVVEQLSAADVLVRLVGFLPAPYQAGDVFPLDASRVRLSQPQVAWRHRNGLVSFAGVVA